MVKNIIMKKIYLILSILMTTVLTVGLSSCSEDSELTTNVSSFESLSFKVNVAGTVKSSIRKTRAASDNKTTWAKGDQIYAVIDAGKSNVCRLEYDGEDWNVSKLSDNVSFKESGKINAVHADKLTFANGVATTFGDILYTQDGEYKKDGNVVYISLNMNVRPVAKIRIDGMPSNYHLTNLIDFLDFDLETFKWTNQQKKCEYFEDEGNGSFVYYGLIAPENGFTTIKIIDDEGNYYEKRFSGKFIKAGDYVDIKGPNISNDWNVTKLVGGIYLNKSQLSLEPGTSFNLTYTLKNLDATNKNIQWISSNSQVATVDSNGNVTAVNFGTAEIQAVSEDGSASATCTVSVVELADLISVSMSSGSFSSLMDGVHVYEKASKPITITNWSQHNIQVSRLSFSSNEVAIIAGFSDFTSDYSSQRIIAPEDSYTFTASYSLSLTGSWYYSSYSGQSMQSWFNIEISIDNGQTITKTLPFNGGYYRN